MRWEETEEEDETEPMVCVRPVSNKMEADMMDLLTTCRTALDGQASFRGEGGRRDEKGRGRWSEGCKYSVDMTACKIQPVSDRTEAGILDD